MLDKLKAHINSISKEDFKKEWSEIKAMGLEGEEIESFLERQESDLNKRGLSMKKSACPFRCGVVSINECSWCGKSYKDGKLLSQ